MFAPALPLGGVAGWRFLERTAAAQQAAFERSPQVARETAYFTENVWKAVTAAELVADRTLLKVALGAFGLEGDLDKRAYIRTILEQGTEDPEALANRLVDPRYRQFAKAFGYGNLAGANVYFSDFAAPIVDAYRTRAFEAAVGETDTALRLALNFRREIAARATARAAAGGKDDADWFGVLGDTPLRRVFEGALGLPREFGAIDVDRQAATLRDRARAIAGADGFAALADPAVIDELIRRFLVREQAAAGPGPGVRGVAALTLLRSAAGPTALQNLIASRF